MDVRKVIAMEQPEAIKFSYRGCEEIRAFCEQKLSIFFEQNVVLWKRSSRQHSFPLNTRILFEFVSFSVDNILNYKSGKQQTWEDTALLHLFFLNPSTIDDYKTGCRNDISEWFSTISKIEELEWLIVFDSTKARDKKMRGGIIERIKNDFTKHTNRIVEIHDSVSIAALQSTVQNHLLAALELYVTTQEAHLSEYNDKYTDVCFDFLSFCRDQMSLARLYQSLGIYEQVLAMFDELDAMLSLNSIHHSCNGTRPNWLQMNPSNTERGCPLFITMLHCNAPWNDVTITELRCIIFAHQTQVVLRVYDERLKSAPSGEAENVKAECAAMVLRYSHHCLIATYQNMATLKFEIDTERMQCWTVAFCLEALQLSSLLAEVTNVKQAASLTCALKLSLCNAMSKLHSAWTPEGIDELAKWFEKGIISCCKKDFETNAVPELRNILSNKQQFIHYLQKYHESSIALLKHFGWRREARRIGWELGKFLISSDRAEGALPYLLGYVSSLLEDGAPSLLLRETVLFTVNHLECFPGIHLKELIDFYLLLTTLTVDENERMKYADRLLEISERTNYEKIRLSLDKNLTPCTIDFDDVSPYHNAAPGDTLTIYLRITNILPRLISNYRLKCIFKTVPQNMPLKTTAGKRPQFECAYSQVDGINRFACVWKGDVKGRRDSVGEFSVDGLDKDEQGYLVFQCENENLIQPGDNHFTLSAKASEAGVFMLDCVHLKIGNSLCLRYEWYDIPSLDDDHSKRPVCFVHRKPVNVKLLPIPRKMLLAGLTQKIEFELSFGTELLKVDDSEFQIMPSDGSDLEFWDPSVLGWSESCTYKVKANLDNENKRIVIYLCKLLRQLSERDSDETGPPTCVEKISVIWMDREWQFLITFMSILDIENRTSLIEDRVLFEAVLVRSKLDNWMIVPQQATLMKVGIGITSTPAKLLNPKLNEVKPGSRYRLVWILPSGKKKHSEDVENYELCITYRAQPAVADDGTVQEIYDREYFVSDEFSIPNRTPSYELCAQVLSSQPGAVLCRVDNPCDVIVSVRSLTNQVESIVVRIDPDPRFWTASDTHKLLYVKESGLGQISFTVFPKVVGFLPYPDISVYSCSQQRTPSEASSSSDESDIGQRLSSFVRTSGKQVHVLGAFSASGDQKLVNEKTNRLKGAKSRITKLFD